MATITSTNRSVKSVWSSLARLLRMYLKERVDMKPHTKLEIREASIRKLLRQDASPEEFLFRLFEKMFSCECVNVRS